MRLPGPGRSLHHNRRIGSHPVKNIPLGLICREREQRFRIGHLGIPGVTGAAEPVPGEPLVPVERCHKLRKTKRADGIRAAQRSRNSVVVLSKRIVIPVPQDDRRSVGQAENPPSAALGCSPFSILTGASKASSAHRLSRS